MPLTQSNVDNAALLHNKHQPSVESFYQSIPSSITTHCAHNSSIPCYILSTGVPTVSFSITIHYKTVMSYSVQGRQRHMRW